MLYDVNTLFFLTMYVEAILGLLLLLAWTQNFATRAVAWWGAAHLLRSLSISLYGSYGSVPDLISIDLAGALLFTSFGVTWTGARVFGGREPLPGSLVAGASLWMVACQFPSFAEAGTLRSLLSAAIVAAFSWGTAYEFWRGREERLVSRWPAILLFFAQGALFLVRSAPLADGFAFRDAFATAWLTILSAEALLFTIAVAFVLLAMAKERAEQRQKMAAATDPLTGLPNRRAFLNDAEQMARQQARNGQPVAVFLADLDRFKSINDTYGHSVGDRVLRLFGEVALANLRSSDLVGRLGGEEFAMLLADADRDNAYVVAERIRSAFETAAMTVGDQPIAATISIGVAVIQDPEQDLATLLGEADQALYRAKNSGRNRVVVSEIVGTPAEEEEPSPATAKAQAA